MTTKRIIIAAALLIPIARVMTCGCGGGCLLLSSASSGYEVTDGQVYFRSFDDLHWKVERREVAGADPARMRTISGCGGLYGTDETNVYYEGVSLTAVDAATFEVIDWRNGYSRDARRVYWHSMQVSDDPSTFQVLGGSYSRDAHRVYYTKNVLEGADVDSFVVTNEATGEATDKTHRYRLGRVDDRGDAAVDSD